MPSPSATCLASPSSTFSGPATIRLRISGFWHLLSSKVNASSATRRVDQGHMPVLLERRKRAASALTGRKVKFGLPSRFSWVSR
jgi:hypothetical protein